MAKTETYPYDPAEYLRDDADMAAYLEAALEDGDPALVAHVLGVMQAVASGGLRYPALEERLEDQR